MTYAQFDSVQASDFNNLCGGNSSTANTLNATWSTGSGSAGYGQSISTYALGNVSSGNTIIANGTGGNGSWANLVSCTSSASIHQGTTITSVTSPTLSPITTVAYNSAIPTNLAAIYANRLNASIQGTSVSNTATYDSVWNNSLTFMFTASFANGDAARYFFNSGGQLKLTCSHPSGTGIDQTLHDLAINIGNVYISSCTSGTITLVGNSFSGCTKVGGGGNSPSPYLTNNGYYALTTANATIFSQLATTGSSPNSNISFIAKSNGTQGSHADTGNVITIYSLWDQVPGGEIAAIGSETVLTAIYPESTYIANTWGTVTLSNTITGS